MNRAPIILGIALIIAAIAPGRAQTTATAAPTEQTRSCSRFRLMRHSNPLLPSKPPTV